VAEDTTNKESSSSVIIVAVIAIIAVLAAGFFFIKYRNEQSAASELQAQIAKQEEETEMRKEEIMMKGEELREGASKIIGQITTEVIKTADEVNTIITDQQTEIDTLNQSVEGLDHKTQCQELLEVGPKNADTWYTTEYSDNFQQDICKYMRDIQSDLDAAADADDEDAVEALEQAEEIAQPYYDNFAEQCSDIYDLETCEFEI
jgi:FtsZ-interacting cell division protein ZipA